MIYNNCFIYLCLISTQYILRTTCLGITTDETELLKALLYGYENQARPVINASHQAHMKIEKKDDKKKSVSVMIMGALNNGQNKLKTQKTTYALIVKQSQISDVVADHMDVNMSLHMIKLQEVNTREQYISLVGWVSAYWIDERLTWNTSDYNGLDMISASPSSVWLPTFVLGNSVSDVLYRDSWFQHYKVIIRHDGLVSWHPSGEFKAHCVLDITYFPFDEQICELRFENWIYYSQYVNLTYSENAYEEFDQTNGGENEEWTIRGYHIYRDDNSYVTLDVYPKVYYKIHLERKPLYYIYTFILQNIFLSLLVLAMFKLPAESGERISMAVTVFLAFSVMLLYIVDDIPNTSTVIPIINIYLISVLTLSTLAICETVLMLYLFDHKASVPPPKWLQKINDKMFEKCLCKRGCVKPNTENHPTNDQDHRRNPALAPTDVTIVEDPFTNNIELNRSSDSNPKPISSQQSTSQGSNCIRYSGGAYMVSFVSSKTPELLGENISEGENINAWRHIARNVDRVSFWLFLVVFILIVLILLIIIPYGHVGKEL